MVAAIPSVMGSHCLDLTKRDEKIKDIDANCQSLIDLFNTMSAQQKQNITEVYAKQGSFLSQREIIIIADNCPNVSKFFLNNGYRIGDAAVKTIAERFKDSLIELNLGGCSNSADQTEFMGNMCRIIRDVAHQIEYITDDSVSDLLDKCHKLSKIALGSTAITTKTLDKIAEKTQLIYLNVSYCYKIAPTPNYDTKPKFEAIDNLYRQRPTLTIVDERGVHAAKEVRAPAVDERRTPTAEEPQRVQEGSLLRRIGSSFGFYLNKLIRMITQAVSSILVRLKLRRPTENY